MGTHASGVLIPELLLSRAERLRAQLGPFLNASQRQ